MNAGLLTGLLQTPPPEGAPVDIDPLMRAVAIVLAVTAIAVSIARRSAS